ncbi:MAG: flagellar FliL protein [Psychromonas sp.]|jgi:flagellar FliL protein|uniref:flagellar basal body-associated FliL family protein n=1 Tax=Psychromonas sp. TaxID=1884585 RepID=UPI0039E31B88
MAEEEQEDLSLQAEEVPQGAGKKKLIIIIIAAVLVLAAALTTYFLFFNGGGEVTTEQTEEQMPAEDTNEIIASTYVAMPRPFVFNVQDGKRDRLVQIKVQLMVHGSGNADLAKKHIPLLEGTLVRVFGAATIDQLRSPAGKTQLRVASLEALNAATSQVEQKALIDAVLFTGFVLQ